RFLGMVPDARLCELYRRAAFTIYPSLYEGFGFPVLDALRHGTPVVSSFNSSLQEFAGPGGFYFDPCDPASLDAACRELLGQWPGTTWTGASRGTGWRRPSSPCAPDRARGGQGDRGPGRNGTDFRRRGARMGSYLGSIWRCRYFWLSLVKMDLRTRYRRSVLGLGWSLLNPMAMTAILCLVFPRIMKVDVVTYSLYVVTNLACWNYLRSVTLLGCQSLFQGEV